MALQWCLFSGNLSELCQLPHILGSQLVGGVEAKLKRGILPTGNVLIEYLWWVGLTKRASSRR